MCFIVSSVIDRIRRPEMATASTSTKLPVRVALCFPPVSSMDSIAERFAGILSNYRRRFLLDVESHVTKWAVNATARPSAEDSPDLLRVAPDHPRHDHAAFVQRAILGTRQRSRVDCQDLNIAPRRLGLCAREHRSNNEQRTINIRNRP